MTKCPILKQPSGRALSIRGSIILSPCSGLDYKRARQIAGVLYTISPQGENTLTVRNGKQALLKALLTADRLDEIPEVSYRQRLKMDDEEVTGMLGDILLSPVLRQVLCSTHKQFFFNPTSVIVARLNRAELGDFDALVLGLLLMAQFKGQIVVP